MVKVGGTVEGFYLAGMTPFFKMHYKGVVQKDFILTTHPPVPYLLPDITKITLSIANSSVDERPVIASVLALDCITTQKPFLTKKKDFNTRRIIGCKVTLRKNNLYIFLFKLLFIVLPKVKQFEGFRCPSTSKVFSFAINDILVFEELVPLYDKMGVKGPLNCQTHFKNKKNKLEVFLLGRSMLLCFI